MKAGKIVGLSTGLLLWCLTAALWVSALLAERLVYRDAVSCQLPGTDSVFGEPGWSWIPLGHTCTWTNVGEGLTVVDYPSMMALAPIPILLMWLLSLMLSRKAKSRRLQGRD